jgi:hypothetical protein
MISPPFSLSKKIFFFPLLFEPAEFHERLLGLFSMCLGTAILAAVCASKRTGQTLAAAAAADHFRSAKRAREARRRSMKRRGAAGSGTVQLEEGRRSLKRGGEAGNEAAQLEAWRRSWKRGGAAGRGAAELEEGRRSWKRRTK